MPASEVAQNPDLQAKFVFIRIFVALNFCGAAFLCIILLSAVVLRRWGLKRSAVWYSFCIAWVLYALSFTLLTFAGQRQQYNVTNQSLCKIQASMIYGSLLLVAFVTLGLAGYVKILSIVVSSPEETYAQNYRGTRWIIIVPWLIFLLTFILLLIISFKIPGTVQISDNGNFFCVTNILFIPRLMGGIIFLSCLASLAFEGMIILLLRKRPTALNNFKQSNGLMLRTLIFTILCFTSSMGSLYFSIKGDTGVIIEMLISSMPLTAAIIFGSQLDMWKAWGKVLAPAPWLAFAEAQTKLIP